MSLQEFQDPWNITGNTGKVFKLLISVLFQHNYTLMHQQWIAMCQMPIVVGW